MPKFVLKVLDGPDAGRQIPLNPDEALRIGRKSSNHLRLLQDEKISGQHAEIRSEDGTLVLADLGSTNGTRVDGKKVEEIPIAHGDRFQIGQTTIQLLDEELGTPVGEDEMSLEIDRELLARTGKRSPVTLLLAILLLAAIGGAGWWFLGGGSGGAGPARPGARQVARIPGNLLGENAAHFETGRADGWLPLATGGEWRIHSRANSGRRGLEAVLGGADAGGDGEKGLTEDAQFAAFASPEQPVSAGSRYTVQAAMAAEEGVRVGLRMAFFAAPPPAEEREAETDEAEEDPRLKQAPLLVAGTTLEAREGSGFETLRCTAIAPPGAVHVRAVLVAVLPAGSTEECAAFADDVGILTENAGAGPTPVSMRGSSWQSCNEELSSAWLKIGGEMALRGLSFVPDAESDPAAAALAKALPMPLNDAFETLRVESDESSLRLLAQGEGRLQLHVRSEILDGLSFLARLAAPEAVRDWGRIFELHRGSAGLEGCDGLLLGQGLVRFLVSWPNPGTMRADTTANGELLLSFPFQGEMRVQIDFRSEVAESERVFSAAQSADRRGELGRALRGYAEVMARLPFDAESKAQATRRRAQMLVDAKNTLVELRDIHAEARAFGYTGLYRQLVARIDRTLQRYAGVESGEFYKQLETLRTEVQKSLSELSESSSESSAAKYLQIHQALREAEKQRLAAMVRSYMIEFFPNAEATQKVR